MKNLVVIFILVLLLSACGSETKEPEATENEAASEEGVDAELPITPIEEEKEEVISVEVPVDEEDSVELEEERENSVEEPEENIYTEVSRTIDAEEIKALVLDYFGASEVGAVEVNDGNIFVSVNLETGDLFTPTDLAVNSYSQLSDELLFYDGWNRLIVEFTGIGTIDMNISEAESNEYGDYFPTLAIEERLF